MDNQEKADTPPEAPQETPAPEAAATEDSAQGTPEAEAAEKVEPTDEDIVEEIQEATDAAAAAEEGPDLEAELADTKDKLLRALAESENVRRRAARDVENATKRAIAGFARDMAVVADNLGRAMDAVDPKAYEGDENLKGLITGIEMTAKDLQKGFERNGITRVDPLGERFDPQLHEAMFEYDDPSKPSGTVGQVMEVGYSLNGQPLRPAKVGVTKGGPKPEAAPTPSEQTMEDAAKPQAGSAYEDSGKPSGTNLDEEL
jgi:molecular chaperone GrpE